jgi:hypothetical protein
MISTLFNLTVKEQVVILRLVDLLVVVLVVTWIVMMRRRWTL